MIQLRQNHKDDSESDESDSSDSNQSSDSDTYKQSKSQSTTENSTSSNETNTSETNGGSDSRNLTNLVILKSVNQIAVKVIQVNKVAQTIHHQVAVNKFI